MSLCIIALLAYHGHHALHNHPLDKGDNYGDDYNLVTDWLRRHCD